MPGGDRTGPIGMGPMSGRAAGFCAGFGTPGYANPVSGRGLGMGFGRGWGFGRGRGGGWGGRGWRHWFHATGLPGWQRPAAGRQATAVTAGQEIEMLKEQAEHFEASLQEIRKRIEQLNAEAKEK